MTFRLTSFSDKNNTTIRVEGRLGAEGVEDLKKAILGALAKWAAPVQLDLSNLQSADAEGVRKLKSYSAKGVKIARATPYIRQLLA